MTETDAYPSSQPNLSEAVVTSRTAIDTIEEWMESVDLEYHHRTLEYNHLEDPEYHRQECPHQHHHHPEWTRTCGHSCNNNNKC